MTKPPILCIHGMWSTPDAYKSIAPGLEAAGYPVHAAEYRTAATGRAGGLAKVGLDDYVSALEGIAARFAEKPIIIGHSMGGIIAQLLAVRIQPRALVLLSTAPSNGSALLPQWSATKSVWSVFSKWGFWREQTLLSEADALYGVFNTAPADEAAAEVKALVPDSGRVLAQIAFAAMDKAKAATVDYARLTCPALVVIGAEDRITPPGISRATARRITGPVTYKEMPGYGHWIIGRDGGPQVSAMVVEFLKAHGV